MRAPTNISGGIRTFSGPIASTRGSTSFLLGTAPVPTFGGKRPGRIGVPNMRQRLIERVFRGAASARPDR